MTPQTLLNHIDSASLWAAPSATQSVDLPAAYQTALQVRALRIARGEQPRGYKIGFTNRNLWPRYNVFAPIWGTVWDTTLSHLDDSDDNVGVLSLAHCCQPRIEPEAVFGMKATPAPHATLADLFDALAWVAPGFEIVQSHQPGWKFAAPDAVTDSSLHARLLVGRKIPIAALASHAEQLDALLASAHVRLLKSDAKSEALVDHGRGSFVLDSPLRALHHFLQTLRECPGATDLQAGDVVTTGTWTDAWPVQVGERWTAEFSEPLAPLHVQFR